MVYIFESELPENKSVFLSLTYIFGLGKHNSSLVCKKLGFSGNLKFKNLSKKQLNKIIKVIKLLNLELSSELKKKRLLFFKNSISIKSYKGFRKKSGLPVRGQRTHTNAKSSKKRLN